MSFGPGEEVIYVGGPCEIPSCGCADCVGETLEHNKLYIVESNLKGSCPQCGTTDLGVRVFGAKYRHPSWAHCPSEFRKPLVVEDEVILKVEENV